MKLRFALTFLIIALALRAQATPLTDKELDAIGRRVWVNECGGTREGLTSWNSGEAFASLGIGHFIWYPKGAGGPFEESFPHLARFLAASGATVPAWIENGPCPWATRAEFESQFHSARMVELRALLVATVRLQSRFLVQRMEDSLAKMLTAAPAGQRENVRAQFERMKSGGGAFALIDYVNFKGEGVKPEERYAGEGWGLLQVLAGMRGAGKGARAEFAESAAAVLARRVRNSPPARNEQRWLAGWKKRVASYAE